jgi:signal transduction histidine kinase
MFRPEYIDLDRHIAGSSGFERLGDLMEIVSPSQPSGNAKWHVDTNGIRRGAEIGTSSASTPQSITQLPNEAILISKGLIGVPEVRYWNSSVFHGDATASWNYWVLRDRTGTGCGWIFRQLRSKYSQLQLQRASLGTLSSNLSTADVMDLRVKCIADQDRPEINKAVIAEHESEAASLLSQRLSRPFFLTGRTFEERMRQFEKFLESEAWFTPEEAFFIEPATRNRDSDLFRVRPIRSPGPRLTRFVPQDTPSASEEWKSWFWDTSKATRHRVFNSFVTTDELPSQLLACIVPYPEMIAAQARSVLLPAFSTFRNTVLPIIEADVGVEDQVWVEVWEDLQSNLTMSHPVGPLAPSRFDTATGQESPDFAARLFDWSRSAYRPLIAIKVMRDDAVFGVYILVGKDQLADRLQSFAELDDLGIILSDVLHPPSDLVDEATSRESLRRLSKVMHQIKGPLGRVLNALSEVRQFLADHPDIAVQYVVPEEEAKKFARMPGGNLAGKTLAGRLEIAEKAACDAKRVSDQLIQLRRVQAKLSDTKTWTSLSKLLRNCVRSCQEAHQDIDFRVSDLGDWMANCDAGQLGYAIDEVLNNSVRELRVRKRERPFIEVSCGRQGNQLWLAISDNGLPETIDLTRNPFEECISTYESDGLGTGLGLTIVRETFLSHDGDCSLQPNFSDEDRILGVTFYAHLKASDQDKEGKQL